MAKFTTSNFLKKETFEDGEELTLTMAGYAKENVGTDDEPDQKWTLHFDEIEEKLPLNKTRGTAIAEKYGYEMDHWIGKQIVVYVDPTVQFGGKRVGGLAVRAV